MGIDAVINATLRYCTTATTRSSPPNSRAMATRPDAPPATSASAPVSGDTSRCSPNSAPATMLNTRVATATASTMGQSEPRDVNASRWTIVPMYTPRTPCAAMPALRGTPEGAQSRSASARPTISAANSGADGIPIMVSGTVTSTVSTANSIHRFITASMLLLFPHRKLTFNRKFTRYNLVMRTTTANATELRESIMALTRQLRRHRSDNGLTLSQQQILGEVSRAHVTTPAELVTRLH